MAKKKKNKPLKIDLSFDELIDLSLKTPPLKKKRKVLKKGKSKLKKDSSLDPGIIVAIVSNPTKH